MKEKKFINNCPHNQKKWEVYDVCYLFVSKSGTYLLRASTLTIWGSTSCLKSLSCSICLLTASMSEPSGPIFSKRFSALLKNIKRFCNWKKQARISYRIIQETIIFITLHFCAKLKFLLNLKKYFWKCYISILILAIFLGVYSFIQEFNIKHLSICRSSYVPDLCKAKYS